MTTDKMRGSQRLLFRGSGKGDRTSYSLCGGDEQSHWRSQLVELESLQREKIRESAQVMGYSNSNQ